MQDALVGFVIDRSGSMANQVAQTVDGFNAFVTEQKKAAGKAKTYASVLLFDTEFLVPFVATDIKKLPAMTPPDEAGPLVFQPRGGTALYDAVATMIRGIEAWQDQHPNFSGRVVVVVMTDGENNRCFDYHINIPAIAGDEYDLNNLINLKQSQGWDFVYMGAGQAAWRESHQFTAVAPASTLNYQGDYASTTASYAGVSSSLSNARATGMTMAASMSNDPTVSSARVDDKANDAESAKNTLSGS